MGLGLTVRGGNPRKGLWACQNAYVISRETGDFLVQVHALVNAFQALCWLGEFGLAEKRSRELEKLVEGHPSAGLRMLYHMARCELALFRGDLEQARVLVKFAVEEAERQGLIYLYPVTLVYDLLLKPHFEQYREAEETGNRLLSFSAAIKNSFMTGISLMWLARNFYFEGEYQRARKLIGQSRRILSSDETRAEYHLHAIAVLNGFISYHLSEEEYAEEDLQKALDHFVELLWFAAVDAHFAMALLKRDQDKTGEAIVHLEAGLRIAKEKEYDHFMLTSPRDFLEICIMAFELEVYNAMDYAAYMLSSRLSSLAQPALTGLDQHPDPKIRQADNPSLIPSSSPNRDPWKIQGIAGRFPHEKGAMAGPPAHEPDKGPGFPRSGGRPQGTAHR